MNDNNAPHYTELPIAQLEENKGQIDGLTSPPPATYSPTSSTSSTKSSEPY